MSLERRIFVKATAGFGGALLDPIAGFSGLEESACGDQNTAKDTRETFKKWAPRFIHETSVGERLGWGHNLIAMLCLGPTLKDEKVYIGPGVGAIGCTLYAHIAGLTGFDPTVWKLPFGRCAGQRLNYAVHVPLSQLDLASNIVQTRFSGVIKRKAISGVHFVDMEVPYKGSTFLVSMAGDIELDSLKSVAVEFDIDYSKISLGQDRYVEEDVLRIFETPRYRRIPGFESKLPEKVLRAASVKSFSEIADVIALTQFSDSQHPRTSDYLTASMRTPKPGLEAVSDILSETRGVLLYQEQLMRICMQFGFDDLEANQIRRALAKMIHKEVKQARSDFLAKATAINTSDATAIFSLLETASPDLKCQAHALSTAATSWMRVWTDLEIKRRGLSGRMS
jgi:hypothetical protein